MMFGQKHLNRINGTYCGNIMRNDKENTEEQSVVLIVDSNVEKSDEIDTLLKLHKQFGPASQEKQLNFIKKFRKLKITRNVLFATNIYILR